MKKLLLPFISLVLILLVFSCVNEPFEGDIIDISDSNDTAGLFKVEFDGQTYVADQSTAVIIDNSMTISGIRGTNQESVIITVLDTSVGTYQLGLFDISNSNGIAYSGANGSNDVWVSAINGVSGVSQGEVVVSEINEENQTISGTFNFTGHNSNGDSKEFVNGVFTNVSYQSGLSNNNDNTFFAKIDGEEFLEDSIEGVQLQLAGISNIGLNATKNSGETISISLLADIAVGDYTFDGFGNLTNIIQYNLGGTNTHIGSGTFSISMHDLANKRIVGTFECDAAPSIGSSSTQTFSITEGFFDVTYN